MSCKECNDTNVDLKECLQEDKTCCNNVDPCNNKYECECEVRIGTDCVHYVGPDMEDMNVFHGDILTDVIVKERSYVENTRAYLENKLNLTNVGKGVEVYKGEHALGFKEFRSITTTGAAKVTLGNDNNTVNIFSPEPITYETTTKTKNNSLIKEVENTKLKVTTILKGLKGSESIQIKSELDDLMISIDEVYINRLISAKIDPSIEQVQKDLERILKEINEKIETFERLVDQKIEDATRELTELIERLKKEIEELGVTALLERVKKLEEKVSFIQPGLVFLWNRPLNTIPKGFKECKDLAGRIPVGMLTTEPLYNALGKTGGNKTITLTEGQMPRHTHTGRTSEGGEHEHKMFYTPTRNDGTNDQAGSNDYCAVSSDWSGWGNLSYKVRGHRSKTPVQGRTSNTGKHSHSMSLDQTGGSQPIDIINPYRVVIYIEYEG